MNLRARFVAWSLLVMFTVSSPSFAGERVRRTTTSGPTTTTTTTTRTTTRYSSLHGGSGEADSVAADIVIARPLWLAETVVGAGIFVLSLPFSAGSRSIDRTAEVLVRKPARATFRRVPGDFSSIE